MRPVAQCMRRVSRYTTLHTSFGIVYAQSQQMQVFAHVLGTCVSTGHTQSQKKRRLHTSLAHASAQGIHRVRKKRLFACVLWHSVCAESANARLCTRPLAECVRRVSKCKTLHTSLAIVCAQIQQMQDFARDLWRSVCAE